MCHDNGDARPNGDYSRIHESNLVVATNGPDLPVFMAEPEGESRGQIVVISDIWGANDFYHDLTRRLAAAGFSAYLPDMFIRQGPLEKQTRDAARARGGKLDYPQAMADVGQIISHQGEERGKFGVIGFCMGGTLVMHLATMERRLQGGVIYYGFPANPTITANRPSEPLRETKLVDMPLLGFWGDLDHGVGMHNVEQYDTQLDAGNKEHEFIIYPGLPHAFLTFDPGNEHFEQSRESWQCTLEFFREKLS
jgi:carboxymethylenebutenolidase